MSVFQPNDLETAAQVVAHCAFGLESEMGMGEAVLEHFATQRQHTKNTVRPLNEQLLNLAAQQETIMETGLTALSDIRENFDASAIYYNDFMADLERHGWDMNIVDDMKTRCQTLSAATGNLEGDLNNARAAHEILKEELTTARLRFEDAIKAAVEKAQAPYDEFSKNAAAVLNHANETQMIAEGLALTPPN